MKLRALSLLAMLVLSVSALSAADVLGGLQFADGRTRTLQDFKSQSVIVIHFCSECPNARGVMAKDVKALHDFIEQQKVPATLVLATPGVTAADLPTYSQEFAMPNALWAFDPANVENISLNNVFQSKLFAPGGAMSYLGFHGIDKTTEPMITGPSAGTFRYAVDGLTDAKAKELWWMVERQRPDAVKTLVAVAKQKSALGADAVKILALVKTAFAEREAALVEAPATMVTYESLEALLTEGQGLELKKAADRYKELGKAKELKDELQARTIYRQCQELLHSPKASVQESGKANLAMLAQKFPATVYGKLAAGK